MFLMVMILFFFKSLNSKQLKNALSLLNWFVLKSQDRIQLSPSLLCDATAHSFGAVEGMHCIAQTTPRHGRGTQMSP